MVKNIMLPQIGTYLWSSGTPLCSSEIRIPCSVQRYDKKGSDVTLNSTTDFHFPLGQLIYDL